MDLSNYVRVAAYDLPEPTRTAAPTGNLLAQEASAVTYNWDTNTLFITGDGGSSITEVSLTGQFISTMTLASGSSPQGTEFYDTEGLTYIGGGKFVLTEERTRQVVEFTYQAGTTLTRAQTRTVDLGTDIGNVGLEGITYDPLTGGLILVKEKDAMGVFQTNIDFAAGTATNGSASTVMPTNLFDPALVGTTDLSEVYALSSNALYLGTTEESHLLILSQESGRIVEIGRDGTVHSSLQLEAPTTPSGISLAAMTVEGLTVGPDGTLYIVSEEGGGDFNHPQLWVYKPAETGPNLAPTSVTLVNAAESILENTGTAERIKVADVAIADDGQGVNALSLTGPDAAYFEVDATGLYLKAGTTIDYEAKQSYAVTVNVDDSSIGNTPDASADYVLQVGNVVNEATGAQVRITEVAPWSSGNSPIGVDWFEVTNTGSVAIDLTGWKVDDSSASFASSVALSGVSVIAPGESVIFIEAPAGSPIVADFKTLWFGGNAPADLQVGTYSGSGIGLGTGGDQVNLYDAAGTLQATVVFGAADATSPYQTFDNTAGIDGATISTLSEIGVNGAAAAANDAGEIGSPGSAGGVPAPVNQAPTAIGLTGEITTLPDNTDTASRVKVASVIVNDDGLGTNVLSLSGADAAFFEVDATGLYVKAGTTLDASTKARYDVTVNVDDPTVGTTPDAAVSFSLDLTEFTAPALRITEVAPWSSGNSPVGADWFEVTNTGENAVNVTGWKVDDSSNAFANAVAITGVSSIGAGESVIFVEGDAATAQAFTTVWFGGNPPQGLQIGWYSGGGIGLSTGGDAVNLFDASGQLQASVSFGASDAVSPYQTFDNSAGSDGAAIAALSEAGVNGAFVAVQNSGEIGSPGRTSTPSQPGNAAPTGITLSNVVSTIEENTGTGTRIKVADVAIADDGLGTNVLSLSGADAPFFEVDTTGLYLKAGTILDYEARTSYSVTVTVDDPTVGGTPDASANYTLNVSDIVNEPAPPQLRFTEVAPWASGNSAVNADWFEITNFGDEPVELAGWKVDDSSASFANAVALTGVAAIGAGESVIFVEGGAAQVAAFIDTWFGGTKPAGLQIGTYSGSGIGLSTGGDGLVLFNASGAQQAKVSFGSSPAAAPFATFDNAAGLDNVTLANLTAVGVNGGRQAPGSATEIGSPGAIASQGPVFTSSAAQTVAENSLLAATLAATDPDEGSIAFAIAAARIAIASPSTARRARSLS